MVSLRNSCVVHTSWGAGGNKDLMDAVVYRFEDEDDKVENRVPSIPSGLHLRAPGSADVITRGSEASPPCSHCTITVSQEDNDSNRAISAVDVLCSAKFMELYSADGEYLCTAEGVRIDGEIASDDQDDHGKLYCLQHSFTAPVTSFMLKFLGLTERDSMWLHSVHLTVAGQALTHDHSGISLVSRVMGTGVDWDKVRELTSDVQGEIPEKARQLWKSVESFQKKRDSSVGPLGAAIAGDSSALGAAIAGDPSSHGMPPAMAAMMSMFAGMITAQRSSSHPGHRNPLSHIFPGSGSGVRDTISSERETGRNTGSIVTATTNKAKYDIAMPRAIDEVTRRISCVGTAASVGESVNNQGDATRKMVPATERVEESDSVRDSASIPQSSALIQQSSAIITRSSAGTMVTHHNSANAPANGALNTFNLDDSASVIQSSAFNPQSSAFSPQCRAGTTVNHDHKNASAPCNSSTNTPALNDSASSPSTRLTSCVHCTEKETHDLRALQETCKQYVSEAEMRIVTVLSKRIAEAEYRTQEKLDAILRHVEQLSSPQNNVVEGSFISLD